jgi:hypothetical protein
MNAVDEETLIRRTADVSCQRFECTCADTFAGLTVACRGRALDIIHMQRTGERRIKAASANDLQKEQR